MPFADYLSWCAEHEPDLGAWAAELDGLPEGDYLGGGEPGPAWQEPEVIEFDAALVADLTRLAARRGLTRNTLVQGAWAVLLARRSGHADVCFGAMVSCRPRSWRASRRSSGCWPTPCRSGHGSTAPSPTPSPNSSAGSGR